MSESELSALKGKVMIAADTQDVCGRGFRKPGINIIENLNIFPLKTAKISAVNENIAIGNGDLPVLSMGIGDDAERCHFVCGLMCESRHPISLGAVCAYAEFSHAPNAGK